MDVWSTWTGKLKYVDGRASATAQDEPARTGNWLLALLRRRFIKALMVANLVPLLLLSLRETGWLQTWTICHRCGNLWKSHVPFRNRFVICPISAWLTRR